jgi:type II secretory pathway component PulF
MVNTGEQSGNLGKVMSRVAEYYSVQLTKRLEMLSKLAEPLMLLIMGVMVGVLVSSLILPIFKLSRAVS